MLVNSRKKPFPSNSAPKWGNPQRSEWNRKEESHLQSHNWKTILGLSYHIEPIRALISRIGSWSILTIIFAVSFQHHLVTFIRLNITLYTQKIYWQKENMFLKINYSAVKYSISSSFIFSLVFVSDVYTPMTIHGHKVMLKLSFQAQHLSLQFSNVAKNVFRVWSSGFPKYS